MTDNELDLIEQVATEVSRFVPDPWTARYFADRIIEVIREHDRLTNV